jgi:hypothetical protein
MDLSVIDKLITDGGDYESFFNIHEHADDLSAIKDHGDHRKIKRSIDQVPVFGFNSRSYDINLIKNDLFTVLGVQNIVSVIKNPSYMCIATNSIKMLDITNYVPAVTSHDSYLTTYLGGCKCEAKIRCLCGLLKVVFPYEHIKSFEVLNKTAIPPKSAFDSSLRGTSISDDAYERVKFVWEHYDMMSIKDLLICYNNLDVKLFVMAIKAQRELFKKFDLDMFTYGVSLPGLSEKVMYHTCFTSLKPIEKPKGTRFEFLLTCFMGFEAQDVKAGREFSMNLDHVNQVLRKQKYICCHCFCNLDTDNVSADRINNEIGHIDGNIMISCIACNVSRKDMNPKVFRYN